MNFGKCQRDRISYNELRKIWVPRKKCFLCCAEVNRPQTKKAFREEKKSDCRKCGFI